MPTEQSTVSIPISPCIRVCTLDDDRICVGCGRSVEEITAWTLMSAEEQRAVLERSEQRRRQRIKSIEEVTGYGR